MITINGRKFFGYSTACETLKFLENQLCLGHIKLMFFEEPALRSTCFTMFYDSMGVVHVVPVCVPQSSHPADVADLIVTRLHENILMKDKYPTNWDDAQPRA